MYIDAVPQGGASVTLSSAPGHLFRIKIGDVVDERRVPSGETTATFVVGVADSGIVRVVCRLKAKEEGTKVSAWQVTDVTRCYIRS